MNATPSSHSQDLWVLGPGESLNYHKEEIKGLKGKSILAFQEVFPNCYKHFKLIPSFWFSADPNAWMSGFEFLCSLPSSEKEKFKEMCIILPHYATFSFFEFRQFEGTTPLGRTKGAWDKYLFLLQELQKESFNIKTVECMTTKYAHYNQLFADLDIFEDDAYIRFMNEKPILGTIPFDSESVIGARFKWGLENKLSKSVFPLAYYLGAKNVFIAGFDFKGKRFYSDDARHPWNDETQTGSAHEVPLAAIKKWVGWYPLHGMRFYNVVDEKYTLLSSILPHRPMKASKIIS